MSEEDMQIAQVQRVSPWRLLGWRSKVAAYFGGWFLFGLSFCALRNSSPFVEDFIKVWVMLPLIAWVGLVVAVEPSQSFGLLSQLLAGVVMFLVPLALARARSPTVFFIVILFHAVVLVLSWHGFAILPREDDGAGSGG